jgi:hypothetical protein
LKATPRLHARLAGLVLALAVLALWPSAAAADYAQGLSLGAKAYEYGIPLVDMQRVYRSSTSVNVPDGQGRGPVNRFSHIRRLANASEQTVVAPNNDTPYSMAWLDLRREPQVLHAPPIRNRFWEFELVDPYTNNFFNITSAHRGLGRGDFRVTGGGDWAVVGPGFHGRLPHGVKRVESPYDRVWVIGRTYVRGPGDLGHVHSIQDRYSITPLSKFGTAFRPRRPAHIDRTPHEASVPGTGPGADPLAFYAALGRQLMAFPPPARDRPLLSQLKAVGIGAGLSPSKAGLDPATLQGLRDAVTQGPGKVQAALAALYFDKFQRFNGYLIGDLGNWGTDYTLRAIGDRVGIGGQRANIATYPFALTDVTGALLNGSKRYVLHFPPNGLPPVKAFWSLTLYDTSSFFVPNPLNRWVINDRSKLRKNPDGSIDVYVQHDQPSSAAETRNWLPAPAPGSGFRLIWRLYDLDGALAGVLRGTGYRLPAIMPCDGTGHAADGTACAS